MTRKQKPSTPRPVLVVYDDGKNWEWTSLGVDANEVAHMLLVIARDALEMAAEESQP